MVRVLFILMASCFAASCAVEVGPPDRSVTYYEADGDILYVNEAPPVQREEVIVGAAPSPNYAWLPGYWSRHSTGWVWVSGRWTARPRPAVEWIPGRWESHPRGHVWVSGHWR